MEEFKDLDQKSIEQQYIESYQYSKKQLLLAAMAAITVILMLIAGITVLALNIIDILVK